jgi:hypothetical protein
MPPKNSGANNLIVSIRISYLEQRDKSRGVEQRGAVHNCKINCARPASLDWRYRVKGKIKGAQARLPSCGGQAYATNSVIPPSA